MNNIILSAALNYLSSH